jgi:hypothetical protein
MWRFSTCQPLVMSDDYAMTAHDDAPPERLWHYTSGAGAKGIFQSRTLWAGHLGYMNDISEVDHAMKNVSVEVAARLKQELPEQESALQKWIGYVTGLPTNAPPNVFAVSFSEVPDLLSQWRGYATGAGGPFCIGFPSATLQERSTAGWLLRKCIYSREEQTRLIEDRIRRGLELARSADVLPRNKSREDLAQKHIYGAVIGVAPLCKHPDFAEEREWRLLNGPVSVREGTSIRFVERRHTLAPFIEFALTEGEAVLDDIHWIAGPGPQQERANSALGMVARIEGMTGYQGVPSHTPYLP